jgi:DNA-directed RNA polymerase specialized sigma24 family protein
MRIERQQHVENAESWTDHELLQRMRRDDAVAIREFYRRFTPVLWKEARRAHVQPALRDDLAIDCLSDSAIHLMQATVAVPSNLTGYLVAAFRHRLANDRRATKRRLDAGAAAVSYGFDERVVREVCSEASLRASAGPAAEAPPLSPVLERLSRVIDAGITDQERQILRWISAGIPQRLIGEWLGITHNAARVRVLRLRDRLIEVALRYEGPWLPGERDELYAFFRRCGLSERALRASQAREQGAPSGAPDRSRPQAGRKSPEEDQ